MSRNVLFCSECGYLHIMFWYLICLTVFLYLMLFCLQQQVVPCLFETGELHKNFMICSYLFCMSALIYAYFVLRNSVTDWWRPFKLCSLFSVQRYRVCTILIQRIRLMLLYNFVVLNKWHENQQFSSLSLIAFLPYQPVCEAHLQICSAWKC